MKITEFDVTIQKEQVLELLNCKPDSPVYEAVAGDFEEILPEALQKLCPQAVLEFGRLTREVEKEAVFCLESVGSTISEWTAELFEQGNYVKGMLADAIADVYLFQLDASIGEKVAEMCRGKQYGVTKRLEAPHDVPLELQRLAWEVTNAEAEVGIKMKDSFMLDPIKSSCQIYIVEKGCQEYHTSHDCSSCPCTDCGMRQAEIVPITLLQGERKREIAGKMQETLLESLRNARVHLSAVCGGKGSCGKCKVRFLQGSEEPTPEDIRIFTQKELEEGWRLACKAIVRNKCSIVLPQSEEDFAVVSDYAFLEETGKESDKKHDKSISEKKIPDRSERRYGIAVDIGTTTIAMQLVELSSGLVVDTYTSMNRQRSYGADVISRIQASNEGKSEALRERICLDLEGGLQTLLDRELHTIERMSISGNTVMIHLLLGYSCKGLGAYPFTPVNLDPGEIDSREIFGKKYPRFPVHVIPGISVYVGGDITAGLLSCGFDTNEKVSMLIDLGTNGEMAIGNKEKILVTSTAAGPAFEGGNILWGTGSIPGAICRARYRDSGWKVETIGGKEPVGICGTGVVEIAHELRKQGWMDETGQLKEPYFTAGVPVAETPERRIVFTQKDVREIQLAKAAIRAGMETLLQCYGIEYQELEHLYIAGGFGYQISLEKAAGIGLLPAGYREKMQTIGNSALKGSVLDLKLEDAKERERNLIDHSEEISLALLPEFNEHYIQSMYF